MFYINLARCNESAVDHDELERLIEELRQATYEFLYKAQQSKHGCLCHADTAVQELRDTVLRVSDQAQHMGVRVPPVEQLLGAMPIRY